MTVEVDADSQPHRAWQATMHLDAVEVLNYAMAHNHIPIVNSLLVDPAGTSFDAAQVAITLRDTDGPLSATWQRDLDLSSGQAITIRDIDLVLAPDQVHQVRERRPARIVAELSVGGEVVAQTASEVVMLSAQQWSMRPRLLGLEMLPAYVLPNAPEVAEAVRKVSDLLQQRTGSGNIEGYQSGAERVDQIVRAIFEVLAGSDIRYAEPPPSWADLGQKVRTPAEVIGGVGTCLDTVLVMAACLEYAGIRPMLWIFAQHAILGWWRDEFAAGGVVADDVNQLVNLVDIGAIGLVETTRVTQPLTPTAFADACQAGQAAARSQADQTEGVSDVWVARRSRIVPIPAHTRTASGEVQFVQYVPADHSRVAVEDAPRPRTPGASVAVEPAPPRVQQWKNALLDLSLRNRLINFTARAGVAIALTPGMEADLEDRLSDDRNLTLQPLEASGVVQMLRAQQVSLASIAHETIDDQFQRARAVFVDLTDTQYVTTLQALAYKARTVREETGANNLYLALGSLVWSLPDGRELRSPMLLMPVDLATTSRRSRYRISRDESGQTTPNYCLVEKIKQTYGVDLAALRNPPSDDHGVDVAGTFAGVRVQLAQAGISARVEPTAHLAVLEFAKYRLWKDLDESWRTMLEQPLVKHLALTPTLPFTDPVAASEPDLDEVGLACPIAADGSQLTAVARALDGGTFVLEGPPGTGKSQTITNLLVTAVASGKRVLFVAEKRAALEVVRRRVDDCGLGVLCLDLHDKSSKPAVVRAQILRALDHQAQGTGGIESATARQRAAGRTLQRYATQLHAENAAGLSLYAAERARLRDGLHDPVPLAPELVAPQNAELVAEVKSAADVLSGLSDDARPGPDAPWGFVTRRVDPAVAPQVLDLSFEVDRRLDEIADTPWTNVALAAAAGELATVALVAGLERPGRVLQQVGTPQWHARVDQARQICSQVADRHRATFATIDPAVLDQDLAQVDAAVRAAAATGWFGRRKRLLQAGAPLQARARQPIGAKELVAVSAAVAAAQSDVLAAVQQVNALDLGVQLPVTWNPFTGAADVDIDAAAHWLFDTTAALRVDGDAGVAGETRAKLFAAADQGATPETRESLRALAEATGQLLRLLAADPADTIAWQGGIAGHGVVWQSGAGFLARWRATALSRGRAEARGDGLTAWLAFAAALDPLHRCGLDDLVREAARGAVDVDYLPIALEEGLVAASLVERSSQPALAGFDPATHARQVARHAAGAGQMRELVRVGSLDRVVAARRFDSASTLGAVGELRRELSKQRRGLSVRALLERYGALIGQIMPCSLVSPDSLARFYPVTPGMFDLVVFDEASQIRVADAVGSMARGRGVVIVGDSKQMPPTSFAETQIVFDDDIDADLPEVVSDEESILSECVQSGLDRHWLSWHYRSQDESLIAFSNAHYYDGRLASFPAPHHPHGAGVHDYGISFHRVDGRFLRSASGRDRRTNPVEARAIVDEIRRRFADADQRPSLGVVTFNAQQRNLIESLLRDSGDDAVVASLDDTEGIFVKNLENVQGDERDVIMFSCAFSVNDKGVLPLNFGPLNQAGGERRLNVAITRARRSVLMFASFDPAQLRSEETTSVGVKHLREYLDVAAAPSGTDALSVQRRAQIDEHRDEIAHRLRAAGLLVTTDVGLSEFRIDLIVAATDSPEAPQTAVLLDGDEWARRLTVSDKFVLPQEVLGGVMRWPQVLQVWLPQWRSDPDAVVQHIADAVRAASAAPEQAPEPLPEPLQEPQPVEGVGPVEPSAALAADSPAAGGVQDASGAPSPSAEMVAQAGADLAVSVAPVDGVRAAQAAPKAAPAVESLRIAFTPWQPERVQDIAILDALSHSSNARANVKAVAMDILRTEQPVQADRLVRLVVQSYGLQQVRGVRAQQVGAVLPTTRDGDAFWLDHFDIDHWFSYRVSDPAERALAHVPLVELANAMRDVALQAMGIGADELTAEVARVFGYARRGSAISSRLDAAIERGLSRRRLTRGSDGRLYGME